MTQDHILKSFDTELEGIRSRVLRMGGLVEQQIQKALRGISEADVRLLEQVVCNDTRVNAFELQLDQAVGHVIARRQPAARDLREIMSMSKVITDIERSGDEAKKIAKSALKILRSDNRHVPDLSLTAGTELAMRLLRSALDAFARQDISTAALTVREDRLLDAEFHAWQDSIAAQMTADTKLIPHGLNLLFIAKSIERIGDHAKNIAEHTIYMVGGQDVRHADEKFFESVVRR